MNIDTRWFEKGYAKEDVHSLRLQSLCTEAEAATNKLFYDSHTREEWEQYIRQASLESSAATKPVMEAIAQDFVCYQYDENIPVPYGSDRWDLYFWCNPFNGAADASERDFSYFTLTFNERQTLEKRRKVCQQVLDLLCSRFQEHPNLDVAVQYSIWFDHPKIHDAVERAKPRLHGLAIPTGRTMQSGFCTYPEYRFRANRLQDLDPEGYAGYLKNFERRCSA